MKNAVHTYICKGMWKYMKGLYIDRHTHTDAFITNNPSQQQQWYKAATGHLRHTAAQSTTAIWRPTFHRHWRTILRSRGKASHHQGTRYKSTVSYCASVSIISLYFSTAVVLQSYWYKPKDKQQQTLLLWEQYFTKGRGEAFHLKEYATTHSYVCTYVLHYKVIEDWGTGLHGI